MTNNVVLVGRLVRNVELRQTSTGKEMTYFTLAVSGRLVRGVKI
jgi:single-strand binding family protein